MGQEKKSRIEISRSGIQNRFIFIGERADRLPAECIEDFPIVRFGIVFDDESLIISRPHRVCILLASFAIPSTPPSLDCTLRHGDYPKRMIRIENQDRFHRAGKPPPMRGGFAEGIRCTVYGTFGMIGVPFDPPILGNLYTTLSRCARGKFKLIQSSHSLTMRSDSI